MPARRRREDASPVAPPSAGWAALFPRVTLVLWLIRWETGREGAMTVGVHLATTVQGDGWTGRGSGVTLQSMTDSPYAVPEEDLFDRARVPVELQVVEQPERRLAGGEEASGPLPFEGSVDADGA